MIEESCKESQLLAQTESILDSSFTVMAALVGNSKTGKTLIFNTITDLPDKSDEIQISREKTIAFDCKEGRKVHIKLWHPVGQERYDSIPKMYYRGINAFLLVFGLKNNSSFVALEKWLKAISENSCQCTFIFLIGTRSESNGEEIDEKKIEQFKKKHNINFFRKMEPMNKEEVQQIFKEISEWLNEEYLKGNLLFNEINKQTIIINSVASRTSHSVIANKSNCCGSK